MRKGKQPVMFLCAPVCILVFVFVTNSGVWGDTLLGGYLLGMGGIEKRRQHAELIGRSLNLTFK